MKPPRYPIYIISKGRWESRLTAKTLIKMRVPFRIVVEPQEYGLYASVLDKEKILTLPFSNLGQGSIPARNWVWEHAKSTGAKRHWILDDNITDFYRLDGNTKLLIHRGTGIFRAAENFVDRFSNVKMAGFHYDFLCKATQALPPFYLNGRCYSCILLDNDCEFRWRGRYNEDTDLSIRILKAGYCTVLFSAFLAGKAATMTMKGGNTEQLYKGDGRRAMAESLQQQHPDIVTITERFGRWQHLVDYSQFWTRNKLKFADPAREFQSVDKDYGMFLRKKSIWR